MIAMNGGSGSCIPAVEMNHLLDPLDYDDGPLQRLAPGLPGVPAEPASETGPVPVCAPAGIPLDVGYPLAG